MVKNIGGWVEQRKKCKEERFLKAQSNVFVVDILCRYSINTQQMKNGMCLCRVIERPENALHYI